MIENGVFCVNVLRKEQSTVAEVFAGRKKSCGYDKFACAEWTVQVTGSPRISNPVASFDCTIVSDKVVGSHHVLFGAVEDVYADPAGVPLLYARRGYGSFFSLCAS